MDWKKVPSVWAGGKPYFYVTFTANGKRTVAWDRVEGKWAVTGDQTAPHGDVSSGEGGTRPATDRGGESVGSVEPETSGSEEE